MENNFNSNQSYDLTDHNNGAVDSNGNNDANCELFPPTPPLFENLPNPAPLINELRSLQASFDYMNNLCGDTFLYLNKIQNSQESESDVRDAYNQAVKTRLTSLQNEFRHFDNVVLQTNVYLSNAKRALEAGLEKSHVQISESESNPNNPNIRSPTDVSSMRG